jgi:SAM-dependent methyltransferase
VPGGSTAASRLANTARRVGRRARRTVLRAAHAANPVDRLPGALARHRDSWSSADVAAQMLQLTNEQLEHPDAVAPYSAFHRLLDVLLAEQDLPATATFLDIGCGIGAYGELLERWAPGRFEYVGADFSEEVVAAAQARWPSRTFVRRDVHEEHALDGFDVVFASALLDVLADYESVLEALCAAEGRWLLLHRQRVGRRSRVEIVPGYRGQRTYRSTVTASQLEGIASRHGRRVVASVPVEGDVHSFLLAR